MRPSRRGRFAVRADAKLYREPTLAAERARGRRAVLDEHARVLAEQRPDASCPYSMVVLGAVGLRRGDTTALLVLVEVTPAPRPRPVVDCYGYEAPAVGSLVDEVA